jgi:hypothetical protein
VNLCRSHVAYLITPLSVIATFQLKSVRDMGPTLPVVGTGRTDEQCNVTLLRHQSCVRATEQRSSLRSWPSGSRCGNVPSATERVTWRYRWIGEYRSRRRPRQGVPHDDLRLQDYNLLRRVWRLSMGLPAATPRRANHHSVHDFGTTATQNPGRLFGWVRTDPLYSSVNVTAQTCRQSLHS